MTADVDFLSAEPFVLPGADCRAEGASSEYSGSTIPAHRSSRAAYLPGEDHIGCFLPKWRAIVPLAGDRLRAGVRLNVPSYQIGETSPSGKTLPVERKTPDRLRDVQPVLVVQPARPLRQAAQDRRRLRRIGRHISDYEQRFAEVRQPRRANQEMGHRQGRFGEGVSAINPSSFPAGRRSRGGCRPSSRSQPRQLARSPSKSRSRSVSSLSSISWPSTKKPRRSACSHTDSVAGLDRGDEQIVSGLPQSEGVLVGAGCDESAAKRQGPAVDAQAAFAQQEGTQDRG